MLPFESVSLVAVLVATLVNMGLGMFWYSPTGFGTHWMKLTNFDKDKAGPMGPTMIKALVANFVGIYAIALIHALVAPATISEAILLGVVLVVALPFPLEISGILWEKRPQGLMWINFGHTFVGVMIMMAILQGWPS